MDVVVAAAAAAVAAVFMLRLLQLAFTYLSHINW